MVLFKPHNIFLFIYYFLVEIADETNVVQLLTFFRNLAKQVA